MTTLPPPSTPSATMAIAERLREVFPFEPYAQQEALMASLYETLTSGRFGVFESPTGTGKSLSVICGALLWRKHAEERDLDVMRTPSTSASAANVVRAPDDDTDTGAAGRKPAQPQAEPDWLADYGEQQEAAAARSKVAEWKQRHARLETRLASVRSGRVLGRGDAVPYRDRKRRRPDATSAEDDDAEAGFLLANYQSDDDDKGGASDSDSEGPSDDDEGFTVRQVLYCSRTHSQISQFVREVKRTTFADVRCVSLGSRRNLCLNQEVTRLRSDGAMSDKCLDLQKEKSGTSRASGQPKGAARGCPFLSADTQRHFSDHAQAVVRDIEELGELGKRLGACPYYGTRKAARAAELVVMPYSVLLHKNARESMGVRLKGNVVILDEAHNVAETMSALYSGGVTLLQILAAHKQLSGYHARYHSRLKGKNLFYVNQILRVLSALCTFLKPSVTSAVDESKQDALPMSINDVLFQAGIDNVNIFKIERYMQRSGICKKVLGFVEWQSGNDSSYLVEPVRPSRHVSDLQLVHSFLMKLTHADKDGRIIVHTTSSAGATDPHLKFIMLNPAVHFAELLSEAHSVVLVGGTLQPFQHVVQELFPAVSKERLHFFACDHIVPAENLKLVVLRSGPTNKVFDFTHQARAKETMIDELGRLLVNTSTMTPEGVVCFLPSYAYEHIVLERWAVSGVLAQITKRKKVFREPRNSGEVEAVLQAYTASSRTGAIIFCVVGAKMSEGLNFSDGLARCVVVVGLPYPDKSDIELQQKMSFLGHAAGAEYYQNLCMRAVNQSIGRSIRHANDYSAVLLVDQRYQSDSTVAKKLPQWMMRSAVRPSTFGEAIRELRTFFASTKAAAS